MDHHLILAILLLQLATAAFWSKRIEVPPKSFNDMLGIGPSLETFNIFFTVINSNGQGKVDLKFYMLFIYHYTAVSERPEGPNSFVGVSMNGFLDNATSLKSADV